MSSYGSICKDTSSRASRSMSIPMFRNCSRKKYCPDATSTWSAGHFSCLTKWNSILVYIYNVEKSRNLLNAGPPSAKLNTLTIKPNPHHGYNLVVFDHVLVVKTMFLLTHAPSFESHYMHYFIRCHCGD